MLQEYKNDIYDLTPHSSAVYFIIYYFFPSKTTASL
jgi:hypothetical protein